MPSALEGDASRWRSLFVRFAWALSATIIVAALVCALGFVLGTIRVRLPYWGEAEVVFEASRVRHGFPLFVDPASTGAVEYGPPPSRYYVTYPPLLSYVLSLVPDASALVAGRVAATIAWFGTLGWIALTAPRAQRVTAGLAAAFVGGVWVLVNFAMTARPDSFACACAGVALARTTRAKRVDVISAMLFALAPWLKPTLLGLPAGALAGDAAARRRLDMVGVAAATALLVGLVLDRMSHGALVEHVVRSNAQPLSLDVWTERITHHLPFFLPLFAVALSRGARSFRQDRGVLIAQCSMVGGLVWTILAVAKTGSSANYWMEPCVAAVVLVAHAPGASFGHPRVLHAALTLASVIYTDVAAISSSIRRISTERRDAEFVEAAKSSCSVAPGDVTASNEQGIELAANGRILTTAYQMSWLVRRGRFPLTTYITDLTAPSVRCLILRTSSPFVVPEIARAAEEHFAPKAEHGDLELRVARVAP